LCEVYVFADTGGLSWKEPADERERGKCRVLITSMKGDTSVGALARLISRQKDVEASDAETEIEGMVQGRPIECRFLDPGKARLFAMVCGLKGAVCSVEE
jgi:hypothetical protein